MSLEAGVQGRAHLTAVEPSAAVRGHGRQSSRGRCQSRSRQACRYETSAVSFRSTQHRYQDHTGLLLPFNSCSNISSCNSEQTSTLQSPTPIEPQYQALLQADALGLYQEAISAAHQFAFAYKQRRPTVQMLFISTRHHYLNNMDRFLYKVYIPTASDLREQKLHIAEHNALLLKTLPSTQHHVFQAMMLHQSASSYRQCTMGRSG